MFNRQPHSPGFGQARRVLALSSVGLMALSLLVMTVSAALAAVPKAAVLGSTPIDLTLTIDGDLGAGELAEATASQRDDDVLGGERDWQATAAGLRLEWDGNEGDPTALDHTGLGGLDLTGRGLRDQFALQVLAVDAPVNGVLTVYADESNAASFSFTIGAAGQLVMPFAAFVATEGSGVDFADVGAIVLELSGDMNGLQLGTLAAKGPLSLVYNQILAVDVNGNGALDAGDVVAHELVFGNSSASASAPIALVENASGRTWTLVPGSISVSQGSVEPAGAGIVAVNLGSVAAGASATVRFERLLGPSAPMVNVILQEGDIPAGGSGPVTSLGGPFTNGNGEVGFTGGLDNSGSTDNFVWFDAGISFLDTSVLPTVLSGAEGTMGIGDNGEFIYSPSVDGDDAVWTHNGLLLAEETQAPGFPTGVTNTFNSRPTMIPGGAAYWISGFNETGGISTQGRMLFTSPDALSATISVVLRADDLVGGIAIDRPSGVGFDYQIADDGSHHIHDLLLDTGGTTDDGIVYLDGAIIARETFASGGGDNWDNFDVMAVNNNGDYLFSGDTDGATTSDEFIAYNGVIAVREGDTLDAFTLASSASVSAASINNNGQAVHAWSASGTDVLFAACDASNLLGTSTVLLAEGDVVDVDGNGSPDATVTDLNASNAVGPGLWLAEDGLVYVEVDLDYGNGDLEAIISLPIGCAAPNISFDKTVGLDPNACALTDEISVIGASDVTYCYYLTNTGNITFELHTVVDDQLGTLLGPDFPATVGPGNGAWFTVTANISTTTVNSATWTANPAVPSLLGGGVSASDTATVTLLAEGIDLVKTVGVVPGVCAVTDAITVDAGTEVTYCYAVTNTGDFTYTNHTLVDDQLGTLLNDAAVDLAPGATYELLVDVIINNTVTNTATWTATIPTGQPFSDVDTATVNVNPPPTSVSLTGFAANANGVGLAIAATLLGSLLLAYASRRRKVRS